MVKKTLLPEFPKHCIIANPASFFFFFLFLPLPDALTFEPLLSCNNPYRSWKLITVEQVRTFSFSTFVLSQGMGKICFSYKQHPIRLSSYLPCLHALSFSSLHFRILCFFNFSFKRVRLVKNELTGMWVFMCMYRWGRESNNSSAKASLAQRSRQHFPPEGRNDSWERRECW